MPRAKCITPSRGFGLPELQPSATSWTKVTLKHGGTGATNIIQRVINNETLPSELVEQSLLAELNKGTADINATKRDAAKAAGGGSSSPVALHFCRMPSGLALAQHHSLPGPWQ